MPSIEVEFNVDRDGRGVSTFRTVDTEVNKLKRDADAATDSVQRLFRQTAIEQSRFQTTGAAAGGGFDPLGSFPGRPGAGAAGGRAVSLANQLELSRSVKEARDFEAAMKRVTQGTDEASKAGVRFHGVTLIGSQVLRQFGVEGTRAIEVVIRQFADMGVGLKDLLRSATFGYTALLASLVGFGEVVHKISGSFREMNERLRELEERGSRARTAGLLTGGLETVTSELRARESAIRDIQAVLEVGDTHRAVSISQPVFGEVIRTLTQAQQQTRLLTGEFDKLQLSLRARGDQDNIFDKTRESLRSLANETKRTGDLDLFISDLVKRAEQGGLGLQDLTNQTLKFKQSLEATHEAQQRSARFAAQIKEEFERVNKQIALQVTAGREIGQLNRALADNPLARIWQEAQNRMDLFRDKFSGLGREMVDKMRGVSNQILGLQLFKENLSEVLGIGKLRAQIAQLQAGLGTDTKGISDREEQRLITARIMEARLSGDRQAEDIARAALLGKDAELARASREARLGGQFVRAAELDNQRDQFIRGEQQRLLDRDIRDRELRTLRGSLQEARGPDAQRFVLDKLIEATNNIGELTLEERGIRLRALQQRELLGEADRERTFTEIGRSLAAEQLTETKSLNQYIRALLDKLGQPSLVQITLKDDSGGALGASVSPLGEAPTPENTGRLIGAPAFVR